MATNLDLCDIQGNIVRGYKLPKYKQLFGTISGDLDRWYQFFSDLLPRVTTALQAASDPDVTTNIGFSHAGLAKLLPTALARAFVKPFPAYAAGMSARSRSNLGDSGEIDWDKWDRRDVWIYVYAKDGTRLDDEVKDLLALAKRRQIVLDASATPGAVLGHEGKRREHFGFRDGIANPVFDGMNDRKELAGNGKKVDGEWVPISTGEFLIGYPNEQGADVLQDYPALKRLLRNGTFAVLRDLKQDVKGFHKYIDDMRKSVPGSHHDGYDLAAKMVGRTRDGKALAASDDGNDFDYAGDPHGARCPLGAHVRRTNPRLDGEHRIIRRGIPYGDFVEWGHEPKNECGLYFVAVNACIETQFEFMQKHWVNGQAGNLCDSKDPMAASSGGTCKMAIEGDVSSKREPVLLLDIPAFVTCRGGQYYFMPGMTGLRALTEHAENRAHPPLPTLVSLENEGALS